MIRSWGGSSNSPSWLLSLVENHFLVFLLSLAGLPFLLTIFAKALYVWLSPTFAFCEYLDGFTTENVFLFFSGMSAVAIAVLGVRVEIEKMRNDERQRAIGASERKEQEDAARERRLENLKPSLAAWISPDNNGGFVIELANETVKRYRSIFYYDMLVGVSLPPAGDVRFVLKKNADRQVACIDGKDVIVAPLLDFDSTGYPNEIYLSLYDQENNLWETDISFAREPLDGCRLLGSVGEFELAEPAAWRRL